MTMRTSFKYVLWNFFPLMMGVEIMKQAESFMAFFEDVHIISPDIVLKKQSQIWLCRFRKEIRYHVKLDNETKHW